VNDSGAAAAEFSRGQGRIAPGQENLSETGHIAPPFHDSGWFTSLLYEPFPAKATLFPHFPKIQDSLQASIEMAGEVVHLAHKNRNNI